MLKKSILPAISGILLATSFSSFSAKMPATKHLPFVPGSMKPISANLDKLKWRTGPNGNQYVYLYGNPSKPGLFILITKTKAGYHHPPHYHDKVVFVTLLRGTFNIGYGNKFIKSKAIHMKATNFTINPPGVAHYEWTDTGNISEIIGIGPWKTFYVDKNGKVIKKITDRYKKEKE